MDRISRERRSANMAAIRGRDTAPERAVRSILRTLGVGYRLHGKGIPGRPDIVMKGRRKLIFVHGCFWHRHPKCRYAYEPKSRRAFWRAKFARTVTRDLRNLHLLRESGWDVLVIWECEAADAKVIRRRIISFLELSSHGETPAVLRGEEAGASRARRAAARP